MFLHPERTVEQVFRAQVFQGASDISGSHVSLVFFTLHVAKQTNKLCVISDK